jgi:hypothetical protein
MKKLKTINLKGKEYVQVNERVLAFNEMYPNGCIYTHPTFDGDTVYFQARITPDMKIKERYFTGHSFGKLGLEKALEKLETVAVGRALAFMGIGIVEGIASADEMEKFQDKELKINPELEKPPVCSICGQVGIKAKTKTGRIFFTCPEWETHKQENETFKMVAQKEPLDEASQQFANSLH